MKKSLKVIASTAMVFSMFASVAMADTTTPATTGTTTTTTTTAAPAAKTTKDFKDLAGLDPALLAKIDAMLAKGVFEGTADDSFGIAENMTRAQFAKVLDLIYGVNVDTTVTTSSFADVKADDNSNGWAVPFIEAAKKAGYIDGKSDTSFDPGANVTLGEFATALVKGLDKTVDQSGTPWYADAVKQAIDLKILSTDADGSKNATRADLVTGAYSAQQAYADSHAPAKASLTSAKAIGVQKVEVSFDKAVDTTKAVLELKKGSSTITKTDDTSTSTVKWSDDMKTATVTLLDQKLRAGDYTVAVSGLDAATVDKTTATFTAQDEVLQKIEFVNASDTIAWTKSTVVKVKATNQYGENASFNSGSYTVYPGGANFTKINKQDDGILALTLDTTQSAQGVGIVSISIVNNDQHVTASKNFKVGTAPILSKLELGDAQYSNSSDAITGKGDTAKFDLNLYDQYGGNISYDSTDFKKDDVNVIWNEYIGTSGSNQDVISKEIEDNGSNIPRLKLSLNDNVDKSGDYTFTVVDQAATATGKISIKSVAIATKVEIGNFDDVIAAGDKDVYIPVVAYDASGAQLSIDDLTSDTNRKRITVNASGVDSTLGQGELMDSGAHRGSIHLKGITGTSKGSVSLTLVIATPNATSTATRNWTVSDVRVPDRIKEITKPAKEIIAGANTAFQYLILDQYGKQMDYNLGTGANGNVGGSVTYDVYVALKDATNASSFVVTRNDSSEVANNNVIADGSPTGYSTFYGDDETDSKAFKQFNKGLRITAKTGSVGNKATLRIAIQKNGQDITYVEQQVSGAPAASVSQGEDWTYTLTGPDTIYNTIDSGILSGASGLIPGYTVSGGKNVANNVSNNSLARRVNFNVKNASGDVVAIPDDFVTNVTSSNQVAVRVGQTSTGKWYALGFKTGTSTLTATYVNNKGETKTASKTVTVTGDIPTITNMTADNKVTVGSSVAESVYYAAADYVALGQSATVAATAPYSGGATPITPIEVTEGLTNLAIYDSTGLELDGFDVNNYNFAYGLSFSIQHVSALNSVSNVTIDSNNLVHIPANFKGSFDIVVTAPSGKSTTTEVTVK